MLKKFHKSVPQVRLSSLGKNVLTGRCLPVVRKLTKMGALAAVMTGRKQHMAESEDEADADAGSRRSFIG